MTTIDPRDLRPGDRVRIIDTKQFEVTVEAAPNHEGILAFREPGSDRLMSGHIARNNGYARTWELIERPKSEPKFGSVWVLPVAESKRWEQFVAIAHGRFVSENGRILDPYNMYEARAIASLVPAEGDA